MSPIFETIEDQLKLWGQSGVSWISFKLEYMSVKYVSAIMLLFEIFFGFVNGKAYCW